MSYTLHKENPVAVLDSGMGGISVLQELVKVLPNENFIYFGDSANAPYGTKTKEEVRELTCKCAKALFDQGAKGLVVACNTATSAAVRILREMYPEIPIVGIEPAVKPAVMCKEKPRVLVLATPMTVREEKLQRLIEQYRDQGDIIAIPCPGLMDFVERGDLDGEDLRDYLKELLADYVKEPVDAAVLGCTHYPFAKRMIQDILGQQVRIFDGGEGTAREMRRRLEEAGLLNDSQEAGSIDFRNSDPEKSKIELEKALFDKKI